MLPREFRNESFRRLASTPSTGIWTPAESRSDRSTSSGRRVDSADFGRRNEPIERAMRAIGLTAGSGIASATSSDSGVSSSASCSWASMMASHSTQGGCGKLYSSTGRNGPNCSRTGDGDTLRDHGALGILVDDVPGLPGGLADAFRALPE